MLTGMLFVNNMIYSFASYLVIEDDYQNYEKIKAAIEKYQLEIDMTQTLDSLYTVNCIRERTTPSISQAIAVKIRYYYK